MKEKALMKIIFINGNHHQNNDVKKMIFFDIITKTIFFLPETLIIILTGEKNPFDCGAKTNPN